MKKPIKTFLAFGSIAALLLGLPSQLLAQNNPLITLDEFGVGSILFPGAATTPLPGAMTLDPGPGGLPNALTYNLQGPPSLVAGDLYLIEPGSANIISDVIRFNPAGTGGNDSYPASVLFYSDNADGADALADIGFPLAVYGNVLFLQEIGPEGNNGATYTPTAGQPGFVAGYNVTYDIISEVPEPTTLALAGLGGLAALVFARRRK